MGRLAPLPAATAAWQTLTVDAEQVVEAFVCQGAKPGPVVAVTAGVHGDEYEGPAALFELIRTLMPAEVQGTVVLIPVANPAAFVVGTRHSPLDNRNLARTFPGNPAGSPTERLAALLFECLTDVDFLIDLHSGGVEYVFLPVAGFYGPPLASNESFLAAVCFGLPALWQLPATTGVLSYELYRRGKAVCGCEYSGAGQLSAAGRAGYRAGVLRCLEAWGSLKDSRRVSATTAQRVTQTAFTGEWMLAEVDGMFNACCEPGAVVDVGDRLALIVDNRGDVRQQFVATEPGTILAIRSKASICRGNWAVLSGCPMEGPRGRSMA